MFQGCSALVTIFVGPEWNTDAVTYDELMFSGCSKIRGINGTTYDSSKMDKTYARIDEGGENRGYMSGGTLLGNMSGGTLKANLAEGRRWATWYSRERTYVIDENEEAEAYTAEYDAENSRLTLHKLGKVIPADHAVIIVSDKDNKNVVMTFDNEAHADNDPKNDLRGFDERYTQEQAKHILNNIIYHKDSYSGEIYMMGMVNSKFGFYRYTGEYTPYYKAILFIPSSTGSSVRAITLSFADNITDVKTVSGDKGQWSMVNGQCSDWYTINGVKLSGKPTAPGMYINNGKKILIK
jgi:hypothetical protein